MKKRILIVAAHPDDEILGCGGTISRLVKKGHEAFTLILGEGITSRDEKRDREKRNNELGQLRKDIEAANKMIGVKKVYIYDFPDNRFDEMPLLDIVKTVEKVKKEVAPDMIFTHHGGDLNIDHRITFHAVLTACRPLKGERAREIYSFEVPSSTEWPPDSSRYFMPNYYIDVSESLNEKTGAMKKYRSEIRDFPHPRSEKAIEILARSRGISVGLECAEAFMLIRKIADF